VTENSTTVIEYKLPDLQGCDVINSLTRRVAKLALAKLETSITRIIVGKKCQLHFLYQYQQC
jgi:hypothetical protein